MSSRIGIVSIRTILLNFQSTGVRNESIVLCRYWLNAGQIQAQDHEIKIKQRSIKFVPTVLQKSATIDIKNRKYNLFRFAVCYKNMNHRLLILVGMYESYIGIYTDKHCTFPGTALG